MQYVFDVLEKRSYLRKVVMQYYCEKDLKFLPDRYVVGKCPYCGAIGQYSDLCEKCGRIPEKILDPKCAICGIPRLKSRVVIFFFKLSNFEDVLEKLVKDNKFLQQDVKICAQ